jgi:hypothetical protein
MILTTKDYLTELSTPAERAKKLGLKHLGFGYWGKVVGGKNVTTHRTEGDKLIQVKPIPSKMKAKVKPKRRGVKVKKGTPLVPQPVPITFLDLFTSKKSDNVNDPPLWVKRETQYAKDQGLSRNWTRPPKVKIEADNHGAIIERKYQKQPQILKDLTSWYKEDDVFKREPRDRDRIYRVVNTLIDENDFRVTEAKELYRGMHFAGANSREATSFLDQVLSGGTIELPPSSFTTTFNVAMEFAKIGDPAISVVFRTLPPKKGFRGMHVSSLRNNGNYKELEVITRSSKYQVMSVLEQETRQEKTATHPKGRYINTTYTIQIQQLEE